jgi:hypothetical protein
MIAVDEDTIDIITSKAVITHYNATSKSAQQRQYSCIVNVSINKQAQ